MSRFAIKLPDIGEGIAEAEIVAWKVDVGDTVSEDQPIVDLLTDKADVELPSPVSGRVVERYGEPGDMVAVGSEIVVLETDETNAPATPGVSPERDEAAPDASHRSDEVESSKGPSRHPGEAPERTLSMDPSRPPTPLAGRKEGRALAAPAVRRRARVLGIALETVRGTGPEGRVTHDDLDALLTRGAERHPDAPAGDRREGVDSVKIIGLRRKIAESLERASRTIPHFGYVEEVDVTELERLRLHLNETRRPERPKLTLLPFLIRALVRAAPEFPQLNATFDGDAGVLHRHAALHVGVATQTPNGLVVPVVRHAESLDVWRLANEVQRLSAAARSGRARREELSGSTITITSLGAIGGIATSPIINAPEVAIIGVNQMADRAMVRDGQIVIRKMLNLSSSFDHRIVDGWNAASFIQRLKEMLEHPASLFVE